jgi:hypothetical protein
VRNTISQSINEVPDGYPSSQTPPANERSQTGGRCKAGNHHNYPDDDQGYRHGKEGTAMLATLRSDLDKKQAIPDSVEEPENGIEP